MENLGVKLDPNIGALWPRLLKGAAGARNGMLKGEHRDAFELLREHRTASSLLSKHLHSHRC